MAGRAAAAGPREAGRWAAHAGTRAIVPARSETHPHLAHRIEYEVVPSASLAPLSPAQVGRRFRALLDSGARLSPAGTARRAPQRLLKSGYTPKFALSIFDATIYLTGPRQNDDIRFLVAYVALDRARGPRRVHPRIFYKDISLTWRAASHWIRTANDNWIGKGDLTVGVEDGQEYVESDEGTTDLPLEIQTALETACRSTSRVPRDEQAVPLILRRAPEHRIAPYADFTAPRRRAQAEPGNLVNRGRPICRFTRRNDPGSLRFAAGYAPDFDGGVLEVARGTSRLYGGPLRRFRIVSENRRVQFLFFAAPRLAWIASCQATSTELSTFAVRTVDAVVAHELLLPGYEYHFVDHHEDPPELYSQVPPGFAGPPSPKDPSRVDTSAWLEAMPVIRDFRRAVLERGVGTRASRQPA